MAVRSPGEAADVQPTTRAFLTTLIVLTFTMNAVSRGATETFAVFLLPVEREFGATRSAITFTYSLYIFVLGMSGPFAGQLVDRLGARITYGVGLTLLGIGYTLAGSAKVLWHYYASVGVLGGMGASCLGMVIASSLLARWFTRRLGSVMAVPYAAMGAGLLLLPPLTQVLLDHYGWRVAHRGLGLFILALLPLIMLLPLERMTRGSPEWQSLRHGPASTGVVWTLKRTLRTKAFWGLFLAYTFTSLCSFSILPQSVAYLVERGFQPLAAASAYGMSGALSVLGIISMGVLSDRIGKLPTVTISYSSTILGIVLLGLVTVVPSLVLVYGFVIFFGSMQGARGPIVVSMIATMFRGGNVGSIFGCMSLGLGIGGALGSWSSGLFRDLTGGYTLSFAFGIACALCGLSLFWGLRTLREERVID